MPSRATQHARTVIGVGTLEQMLDVPDDVYAGGLDGRCGKDCASGFLEEASIV